MNTDQQTVQLELPCMKCGRSLRDLPVEGLCPDCGTTVVATLAVTLDNSIARWGAPFLARLENITRRLAWTGLAYPAALVIYILLDSTFPLALGPFFILLTVVATFLHARAAWDSTSIPEGPLGRREKCVRIGAALMVMAAGCQVISIWRIWFWLSPELQYDLILAASIASPILAMGVPLYTWATASRFGDLADAAGMPDSRANFRNFGRVAVTGMLFFEAYAIPRSTLGSTFFLLPYEIYEATQILALIGSLAATAGVIGLVVWMFKFTRHVRGLKAIVQKMESLPDKAPLHP